MRANVSRRSDTLLLHDLHTHLSQERTALAEALADIAEVEERRLYLPAGYPSMFRYCVGALHLSEQAAIKRIRAARKARQFPAILGALAEGRLHLSAVVLLGPHLGPDNADELLAAATHRTRAEIEQLIARRFPRPDLPARLESIAPALGPTSTPELSPGTVESAAQVSPGTVAELTLTGTGAIENAAAHARVKPLSAERFALQLTIGKETHDKLRHVQSLLSHCLPSGDLEQVLDRALDALESQLEKRKFGATAKPRARSHRPSANPRHIPAAVKRAVWERDGGRCTFVGDSGRRCDETRFLEFDHVDPVARGGRATVAGIRLRCRAHNQYEAERTFGEGFMSAKREAARQAAAEARERKTVAETQARAAAEARAREAAEAKARAVAEAQARAAAEAQAREAARQLPARLDLDRSAERPLGVGGGLAGVEDPAPATAEQPARAEDRARAAAAEAEERADARQQARDVLAGLRELGVRADKARHIAARSETLRNVTLEERMRAALKLLSPKARHVAPGVATSA